MLLKVKKGSDSIISSNTNNLSLTPFLLLGYKTIIHDSGHLL